MQERFKNPPEVSKCKIDCAGKKPRPVCATDGNTYRNKCEVRKLRKCEGKDIDVKSKGKCKGSKAGTYIP